MLKDLNLVIFPHAGEAAVFYIQWARKLNIKTIIINYKGHMFSKYKDEEITIISLAEDAAWEIYKTYNGDNLIFFGHSMGGNIALETLKILNDKYKLGVGFIILSAVFPLNVCISDKQYNNIHNVLMNDLNEDIRYKGLIIEKIFDTLKRDLHILREYLNSDIKCDVNLLNTSIIMLYFNGDSILGFDTIFKWKELLKDRIIFYELIGDHLSFNDENLTIIKNIINSIVDNKI